MLQLGFLQRGRQRRHVEGEQRVEKWEQEWETEEMEMREGKESLEKEDKERI